jgi:hypothetical protein
LETADLLFVGEEGVDVYERFAQFGFVRGELLREFDTAFREDGHFQRETAARAPGGFRQRLDEIGFLEADGLEFVLIVAEELAVLGDGGGGEQRGAAG